MTAWQAFDEAKWQAFQAGRKARKRGNAQGWLKRHKAPAVTVEQLLLEAYELGQRDGPVL